MCLNHERGWKPRCLLSVLSRVDGVVVDALRAEAFHRQHNILLAEAVGCRDAQVDELCIALVQVSLADPRFALSLNCI